MNAKDKAAMLVKRYLGDSHPTEANWIKAKNCAITAVNIVLETLYEYHYDSQSGAYEHWQEVYTEIELL